MVKKSGSKNKVSSRKRATSRRPHVKATSTAAVAIIRLQRSRDEIYHRLEWLLDPAHNPSGSTHSINPRTKIESFFKNYSPSEGRQILYRTITKACDDYIPAIGGLLFDSIRLPWLTTGPIKGVRDVKTLSDLINAYVAAYTAAGWKVT
jgi:hypothetical protein